MLRALFGVLNALLYVVRAFGPVFSVSNVTVALVNESHVSKAAASTSEG